MGGSAGVPPNTTMSQGPRLSSRDTVREQSRTTVRAGRKAALASKGKFIFMSFKCIFLSVTQKKKKKILKTL